jgi:hypothetical protein
MFFESTPRVNTSYRIVKIGGTVILSAARMQELIAEFGSLRKLITASHFRMRQFIAYRCPMTGSMSNAKTLAPRDRSRFLDSFPDIRQIIKRPEVAPVDGKEPFFSPDRNLHRQLDAYLFGLLVTPLHRQ